MIYLLLNLFLGAKHSNEKYLIRILKLVPLTDQINNNGCIQSKNDSGKTLGAPLVISHSLKNEDPLIFNEFGIKLNKNRALLCLSYLKHPN